MKIIWIDAENGSDSSGSGTYDSPYRTIEHGLTFFEDGDQIRLKDGIYATTDSTVVSGMSGSIFSENPGGAVIQPIKTRNHQACLAILDCERFLVQGVRILQAADTSGNTTGLYCENVENLLVFTVTISDFEIPSGNGYGIFTSGSLGRIENCRITDLACAGEYLYGIKTYGIDPIYCFVDSLSGAPSCNTVIGIDPDGQNSS